jgi:formylmethanofuran dehydrogenase subunit A
MNARLLFSILLVLFVMTATFPTRADKPPFASDLIIINARIHTMDQVYSLAEAVAVSGNRIVAVGSTKEISKLAGANTRVIDAKGQLVLPGFNDAHVHFNSQASIFATQARRRNSQNEFAASPINCRPVAGSPAVTGITNAGRMQNFRRET